MKKKIIAANFKMNKTNKDIKDYFDIFMKKISELTSKKIFDDIEIVFAPPFTSLCEVHGAIGPHGNFIKLSSQNIYYEKSGAFTGEISLDMIKDCGCVYAIIGHSERRGIFGESDELIGRKLGAIYGHNYSYAYDNDSYKGYNYNNTRIIPILCVGEHLIARDENRYEDFVANQLNIALNAIKGKKVPSLIIAYEPIWAIGTGTAIKPEDGERMHEFIYNYVHSNYMTDELRVIYGGSITELNIKDFMDKPHIDGVLVGGASLDPSTFFNIAKLSAV